MRTSPHPHPGGWIDRYSGCHPRGCEWIIGQRIIDFHDHLRSCVFKPNKGLPLCGRDRENINVTVLINVSWLIQSPVKTGTTDQGLRLESCRVVPAIKILPGWVAAGGKRQVSASITIEVGGCH